MLEPNEQSRFIGAEGKRLYAMLHTPVEAEGGGSPRGLVCCAPFAEEAETSLKVMSEFARFAAARGYWTLRFDYHGCGDSGGDYEEATLQSRIADIVTASRFLGERIGGPVSLMGLRLGATLALLASVRLTDVRGLILWEPIARPDRYVSNFMRTHLMAEAQLTGRNIGARENMVRELRSGNTVHVLGYPLSAECYQEFVECDPGGVLGRAPTSRRLVVAIGAKKRQRNDLDLFLEHQAGGSAETTFFYAEERPFWIDPNDTWRELRFWKGHEGLFSRSIDWLDGAVSGKRPS